MVGVSQMVGQPREPGEVRTLRRQDRHADKIRLYGGDVRLAPLRPVHFDEFRPRRYPVVPADAVPSWASGHHADTDGTAHRRVQSVGGDQPFRPDSGCHHALGVLLDLGDPLRDPFGVLFFGARCERSMQGGTSNPATSAVAEWCFDSAFVIEICDPPQGHPGGVYTQRHQFGQAARHQALAACLVDRIISGFRHDHRKPLLASIYRRCQTGWSAADDQQVSVICHRRRLSSRWSASAPAHLACSPARHSRP